MGAGLAVRAMAADVDSILWVSSMGLWARYSTHAVEAGEGRVGMGYGGSVSVDRRDADILVVAVDKEHRRKEFEVEEDMRRMLLLRLMGM